MSIIPIICNNFLRSEEERRKKNKKKEDFDFDTWLESQPEGTFVQGGGLDGDFSENNDKKD